MNGRNFQKVANEIIKVIDEECDFNEERISNIIKQIEKIIKDNCYTAPELQYMNWNDLAEILSNNFVPSNSKWETKIMIIFNDLPGTIEDYWDLMD